MTNLKFCRVISSCSIFFGGGANCHPWTCILYFYFIYYGLYSLNVQLAFANTLRFVASVEKISFCIILAVGICQTCIKQ